MAIIWYRYSAHFRSLLRLKMFLKVSCSWKNCSQWSAGGAGSCILYRLPIWNEGLQWNSVREPITKMSSAVCRVSFRTEKAKISKCARINANSYLLKQTNNSKNVNSITPLSGEPIGYKELFEYTETKRHNTAGKTSENKRMIYTDNGGNGYGFGGSV